MAQRKWFKGRAARAVDDWYSSGSVPNNLTEAKSYLVGNQPFGAIVAELGRTGHTKNEFVYPLGDGALQGPDFERVTRQGYLEAIGLALNRRAQEDPVPITTFWMTGAGNDRFEAHITDGAGQVSLTLLVPEVEGGSEYEDDPESWVVTLNDDDEVETRQTSGPPAQEQPSARGDTSA